MTTMTKQDIINYFSNPENMDKWEHQQVAVAAMYHDWEQPEDWENVFSKSVYHYGGEDCGSTYYTVWQFDLSDGTTFYLRFDGWYASHYGCDYQDFREVKPKEVTKIEFV